MLKLQFEWKNIFSPKVLYPIFVALLFVVYTLGRMDGTSKAEDNFETYRKNSEKIIKNSQLQRKFIIALEEDRQKLIIQYNKLDRKDKQLEARLSKMQKTIDSLNVLFGHQLDSLPKEVPPVCSPWANALSTCQIIKKQLETQVDTLKEQVQTKEEKIGNLTGQIDNLLVQRDSAVVRGDSLQAHIQKLPKPETCKIFKWFGPKCPSRTTVAAIATTIGTIGGFILHSYLIR